MEFLFPLSPFVFCSPVLLLASRSGSLAHPGSPLMLGLGGATAGLLGTHGMGIRMHVGWRRFHGGSDDAPAGKPGDVIRPERHCRAGGCCCSCSVPRRRIRRHTHVRRARRSGLRGGSHSLGPPPCAAPLSLGFMASDARLFTAPRRFSRVKKVAVPMHPNASPRVSLPSFNDHVAAMHSLGVMVGEY